MTMTYYSTLRPVGIGTFPRAGFLGFENYDHRKEVEEIDHRAWGELYYDRELTHDEMCQYDLVPSPKNSES